MRCLIDTSVFINMVEDDYIADNVRAILEDYENIIYVSSESVKEFVHLMQNGKITPNKKLHKLEVFDLIENTFGLNVKYVTKEHLQTLAKLALVEGHNDPSDRLIISQSLTEKIPLISSDTKFPKYRKHGLDLVVNR